MTEIEMEQWLWKSAFVRLWKEDPTMSPRQVAMRADGVVMSHRRHKYEMAHPSEKPKTPYRKPANKIAESSKAFHRAVYRPVIRPAAYRDI